MDSMTWEGRCARGIGFRLPSASYFPGQRSSGFVTGRTGVLSCSFGIFSSLHRNNGGRAEPAVVALLALCGDGQRRKCPGPQVVSRAFDLPLHVGDERLVHGARLALSFVKLVDLHVVGVAARKFAVAESVNV